MDLSSQDHLLSMATELGVSPDMLIAVFSKHLNAPQQNTKANASDSSLSGVEVHTSTPSASHHPPLGSTGLAPPSQSTGSSLALPSVAPPPVAPLEPLLPTLSSQCLPLATIPLSSGVQASATLSSQFPLQSGGAMDYFQNGPATLVALPSVPTAHPRLQAIQQAASVQPQVTNQPSAVSQQLLPWETDQHVVTQWGAAGPVPSIPPMPSAVPTALASAFATSTVTPSRLGRNPDRPLPPVTAKLAASISGPRRRRKSETAEKPKARQGVPISYKKLYVIPVATITHLTEQVKFACSVSNLAGHPDLHNAMTDEEVRQEIRNFFTKERCGIDWRLYSPEWFELSRQSGPLLWPTNLKPLPTGKDLAKAYQGKQLIIIRLNGTANIPAFAQNLKQAKVEFRKASGSSRSRVRRRLSDDSDNVIKSFTCKGCDGTFELRDRALHEEKCPARLPRKRKISTSSRHSRHRSEPPDVSPVATRKTKRIRAEPASSDGEIETRARASKKFQPKTVVAVEETDVEGLGEEEIDELFDDPLADEDELELGDMGSYRESSLEIYGGREGDSEVEDDEDQEEEGADGLDAALDDEDFDPTYQAADSGDDEDEDEDEDEDGDGERRLSTSAGARSGPSRSRTKGGEILGPTLCPFCDETLPENPSTRYHDAVAILKRFATPDPTPANPHHLYLPLTRSITACALHRSETRLSAMEASGQADPFPESIDFKAIPLRVANLQAKLQLAAQCSIGSPALEAFRYGEQSLRTLSDQHRATTLSHTGYYGEQGREIILESLLNLFPPRTFRPSSILSPSDFICFILLPYTAFLLMTEDNPLLGEEEVWALWESSRQYGLDRYPSIDGLT